MIKDWDAICSATIGLSEIRIGTKYVRTRLGIDELIAVMEHELGPFQQGFIARKLTPNHVLEYQADRVSKPLDMIAVSLSKLAENKSWYYRIDKGSSHPNDRKRIKASLEQMLGNDIFVMNGTWQKRDDGYGYYFRPNTIGQSHSFVKNLMQKNIGFDKEKSDAGGYMGYCLTEDGRIVTNWAELQPAIEQKSEELMKKLDGMIGAEFTTFTIEQRYEWLDFVEKEVIKFKETHKPRPFA